jgi:creatinine amidohydrolase
MLRSIEYGKEYRYDAYTWEELKEVIKEDRVAILPIGSVEQHGKHLPIDTDNFILEQMCIAAAEKVPNKVLLLPLISYGFCLHQCDFPGPLNVSGRVLSDFVLDINKSLSYHGIRRILLVNGHGSNAPYLDDAARRTILETNSQCATFITYKLANKEISEVRESEWPGGIAHACEMETSVYLYLAKERVRPNKAEKDIGFQKSDFHWVDTIGPSPVSMRNWLSSYSKTGVIGDPTLANEHKGKIIFDAVVEGMVRLIEEFKKREFRERVDHH